MAAPLPTDERSGADDIVHITEQTPFISESPTAHGSVSNERRLRRKTSPFAWLARAVPRAHKPSTFVILCVSIFIGSASGGFQSLAMTRIFEDILCRQYYDQIHSDHEPIDEEMCKVDAIQSKLAYLFAIMNSLNAAVSVVSALPWGIAADK
ncbi:hypothetical protein RRF57_000888 [Xylaria bambusicola]|uniref:Uncharacterized protein n=1 Tax=Xylaria bambusicola TaxID=326684 RepID=A0AAN7Z054_9PEZI